MKAILLYITLIISALDFILIMVIWIGGLYLPVTYYWGIGGVALLALLMAIGYALFKN
jgi:hypothetical protein